MWEAQWCCKTPISSEPSWEAVALGITCDSENDGLIWRWMRRKQIPAEENTTPGTTVCLNSASTPTSCVTQGKSVNLSGPQLLHLSNGGDEGVYHKQAGVLLVLLSKAQRIHEANDRW